MSLLLTFGFPLALVNASLMQRYVLCGAVLAPVDASNFEKVTVDKSELDAKKIGETRNEHNTWDPERLVGQNQANADNERTSQKK